MSTNNYLCKALDAYPYDLEETMEALNYALSYQDENQEQVLCLLGKVYAEAFEDYEKAIGYFKEALSINPSAIRVFKPYVETLINAERFGEATAFISYALKVKGSDKAVLYYQKSLIAEINQLYDESLINLKKAEVHTYNEEYMYFLKSVKKRVKGKRKVVLSIR